VQRLRFPRLPPDGEFEPTSPAPPPEVPALLLGRREFLAGLGAVLVALASPFTRLRQVYAAAHGRFFTAHEFATLEALCDRILPADRDPGARDLGAATYIERLLTAFDRPVPLIFAGGPFSNRNPFPDNATGTPSSKRPRDAFRRFIRLTRWQRLRWRAELFGSDHVTGAAFNDAAAGGRLPGLRQIYREGLRKVDGTARSMAGAPYTELSSDQQDAILATLDRTVFKPDARRGMSFVDVLIQHTLEGCFSLPEYGGNRDALGWTLLGLEGDDQPLGYSIYSAAKDGYNERCESLAWGVTSRPGSGAGRASAARASGSRRSPRRAPPPRSSSRVRAGASRAEASSAGLVSPRCDRREQTRCRREGVPGHPDGLRPCTVGRPCGAAAPAGGRKDLRCGLSCAPWPTISSTCERMGSRGWRSACPRSGLPTRASTPTRT